jgi:malonyl-CoA O-methyltransferase
MSVQDAGGFGIALPAVRRAFDRAAQTYDAAAVLQREVLSRALERLELIDFVPARILDVGSGTGHAAAALARRYRKAGVNAVDLSERMLHEVKRNQPWLRPIRRVCADAAALPFADESIDLLFSNLMLQWCADLDAVFAEFRRLMRARTPVIFTTFGPDTLKELRAAWSEVDGYTHVNRFVDMHDIGDALVRAGFVEPVMDVEHLTLTYGDVYGLMRDLKQIGAHNINSGRAAGLTGPRRMRAFAEVYERFRADGRLPATYEVIYGTAWAPMNLRPVGPRTYSGDED